MTLTSKISHVDSKEMIYDILDESLHVVETWVTQGNTVELQGIPFCKVFTFRHGPKFTSPNDRPSLRCSDTTKSTINVSFIENTHLKHIEKATFSYISDPDSFENLRQWILVY